MGAFVAIEFVTVVEKLASAPSASLSSFNVSKLDGDELTKSDTAVLTYAVVLIFVELSD